MMKSTLAAALTAAIFLAGAGAGVAEAAGHERAETLKEALGSPARPEADRARDAGRKPAEVVTFLGIEEGMTVVDLIAAGGYYTEVLSVAVGPDGSVYAQNPAIVLQFRDGANDKALTERLADGRLPNVERWDRELDNIGLAPGSVDAAITALNFHDYYNRSPEAAANLLAVARTVLKPGGVLGVIDHAGNADADNAELHRIEEQKVVDAAIAAGFEIADTGGMLRNPEDDRSTYVFDPSIRGKTDRFVLKLRKPE